MPDKVRLSWVLEGLNLRLRQPRKTVTGSGRVPARLQSQFSVGKSRQFLGAVGEWEPL